MVRNLALLCLLFTIPALAREGPAAPAGATASAAAPSPVSALTMRVAQFLVSVPEADAAGSEMGVLRGRFQGQLNALVSSGKATLVSERRQAAADGCPVDIPVVADANEAAFPEISGVRLEIFTQTLQALLHTGKEQTVDLTLTLRSRWSSSRPAAERQPGNLVATVELPRLSLREGEQLLLYGWEPVTCAARDGRRRQMMLLIEVSRTDPQR